MKLSFLLGIAMLALVFLFSISGCRSVAVRWMNGGEPIDNPCKWECDNEGVCVPYLTEWDHDTSSGGGF